MLYVTLASPRDIRRLAPFLREDDRREVEAATGYTDMTSALLYSYYISTETWCIKRGTVPVGVFGCVPLNDGGGIVWMLGSDLLTNRWVEFARSSLPFISRLFSSFNYVTNAVAEWNTLHIRWLEWLGAKFDKPTPHGPAGALFRRFYVCHSTCRYGGSKHRRGRGSARRPAVPSQRCG